MSELLVVPLCTHKTGLVIGDQTKRDNYYEDFTITEEDLTVNFTIIEGELITDLTITEGELPEDFTITEEELPEDFTVTEGDVQKDFIIIGENYQRILPLLKKIIPEDLIILRDNSQMT